MGVSIFKDKKEKKFMMIYYKKGLVRELKILVKATTNISMKEHFSGNEGVKYHRN